MERHRRFLMVTALALVSGDALLTGFIVAHIPYTKIDWDAYMSQVSGFLSGQLNYSKLEGDTGPLVYPAGFLYIYAAIQGLTNGSVYPAQILFGLLYLINLSIILLIYVRAQVVPWWALPLLCLSKRLHSIFVLRLFNDCVAVTLAHASIALLQRQRWYIGLFVFSLAVSVKMNILLYAPPLLLLLLKALPLSGVVAALSLAATVQFVLGLPFLATQPIAYVSRAFNLGRVFIHFWSVNLKFVPEYVFVSKPFALGLMILHIGLLIAFAHYKWCKHEGGIVAATTTNETKLLSTQHITTVMFVGNFIGIVAARSLHYQFYSWYFYSLPYLLWKTRYPTVLRLMLFVGIEVCWNIYPSSGYSSMGLLLCHLVLLYGLWSAPSEFPYSVKEKKNC